MLLALGEGTRSSQTTALASDIFRDRGLGFINGLVGAMFGAGAAASPWFVGYLRDHFDSYTPGLEVIIALLLVSMVGFVMVNVTSRRSNTRHLSLEADPPSN
jgi:MFS family permease